jgi:transcriptional regulator with XRE-family HTH domain
MAAIVSGCPDPLMITRFNVGREIPMASAASYFVGKEFINLLKALISSFVNDSLRLLRTISIICFYFMLYKCEDMTKHSSLPNNSSKIDEFIFDTMLQIHEKIEQARISAGLSQEDMAEKLGIGRSTYQYWEKKTPSIDKILKVAKALNLPEDYFFGENDENIISDSEISYSQKRLTQKNTPTNPLTVPLVPVKAQAGYVKAIDQSTFIDTLEQYALPPGVNPQGAIWRYWEVEGSSMEPAFNTGDVILTSQVHQMDWENLRNFYLYVIVTDERVLFKRVFCKNSLEWVLISENEEQYPQQILPVEYIKEVWVFRRSIIAKAPPTKEFKITV